MTVASHGSTTSRTEERGGTNVAGEVNRVFQDPTAQSRTTLVLALYLFAFQIYGDFAGYSSIARGSARLLGIQLMRNFDQPYLSTNLTDFWRRWHRSLSFWLRDYVYIPLGGNRHGALRTYRNLLLTMLVGGLWHGASWTFVVWGALHGIGLALDRGRGRRLPAVIGMALTFHLVLLSWLFFRAKDLTEAWNYAGSIVYGPWLTGWEWDLVWRVALYGSLLVLLDVVQARARSHTPMVEWSWPARVLALSGALIWLLVWGGLDVDIAFIYFQF